MVVQALHPSQLSPHRPLRWGPICCQKTEPPDTRKCSQAVSRKMIWDTLHLRTPHHTTTWTIHRPEGAGSSRISSEDAAAASPHPVGRKLKRRGSVAVQEPTKTTFRQPLSSSICSGAPPPLPGALSPALPAAPHCCPQSRR